MARAEDKYKLYITNLDPTVDENDLSREFERFGVVNSVQISRDQYGSATVEYADRRDAEDACRAMDGATMHSSRIYVEFARGRESGLSGTSKYNRDRRTSPEMWR
ncbi:RNA-binding protein 1-like [Convolutriloba macropyga]|uniref:RNA-binding protein 1-like n=1 Tax=Convolutriloba macropyga TaxID=536237 RepID=UPI003F52043E